MNMYNNKIDPKKGVRKGRNAMRKLILLFTLFAFACTPLVALSAANAYGGLVEVQSKTVLSGETFTVDITLSGNEANITSMVIPIIFDNTFVTCTGVDFSGTLAAGDMNKDFTISGNEVVVRYMASYDGATTAITQAGGLIATLQLKVSNNSPSTLVIFDGANVDISFEANGQLFGRWNRLEFADESGGKAIIPGMMPGLINIRKSTDIDDTQNDMLPQSFGLSQNYPNPFNPATKISFALPTKSNVRLEIFNLLGQKVANLVQGEMEAGFHEITWNAGQKTPSGVYFYRLISDDKSLTRKMMLLK